MSLARRPQTPLPMSLNDRLQALDRLQQRHRWLSFPAAVIKKFGDDEAGQLAALIAYYGFVSLFPLLLVLVTVLGFVLEGDPKTQASVLHSTLGQFPIIGDQLQRNIHSLKGSAGALAIGVVGLAARRPGHRRRHPERLPAGLAHPAQAPAQLPRLAAARPRPARRPRRAADRLDRRRGLRDRADSGPIAVVGGILLALVSNLLLFFAAFRLLTPEEIPTRDLIPGVIFAAVLWQLLQHIGGYYVAHVVRHAQETSGLFAFVLGLLAWLYLGGQVTLIAAEINVVRARRLWPRSFFSQPLLDADKRALTSSAETEERVEEENVEVNFDGPG